MKLLLRASLILVGVVMAAPALAVPLIFSGIDAGAGPADARPNSDAAYAAWLAALGGLTVDTVTFEGTNTGDWSASGDIDTVSVRNDDNLILGYNTTAGGDNFLGVWPDFGFNNVAVTFNYATPINAWGAFITGLEPDINGYVTLTYPGSLAYDLLEADGGGVQFFGFVDFGGSVTSVTLSEFNEGEGDRDIWGVDDVSTAAVPEPATLMLLGGGLAGLALRRRRQP